MSARHTPGPVSTGIVSGAIVIYGDSTVPRTVVARVPNRDYPEHAAPNAARIVLCWNSHDALVAALQKANEELCALIPPPFDAVDATNWPDTPNWADKQCLTYALKAIRGGLAAAGVRP